MSIPTMGIHSRGVRGKVQPWRLYIIFVVFATAGACCNTSSKTDTGTAQAIRGGVTGNAGWTLIQGARGSTTNPKATILVITAQQGVGLVDNNMEHLCGGEESIGRERL